MSSDSKAVGVHFVVLIRNEGVGVVDPIVLLSRYQQTRSVRLAGRSLDMAAHVRLRS